MSRNNDVFQVLIPTVATALSVGSTLDDLLLGQLAAFDYETNLSIVAPTSKFYWAVGVDNTGANAVKNDIVKSTGTHIQSKNIVSLTNQCYVAPVEKVVELSGWTAECNTEYGVKFEIRNQEAYRLNGYNQVIKNYTVVSPDCVDCNADCPSGDCFKVASDLMTLINEDPDAVITASAKVLQGSIEVTNSAATGVVTATIGAVDIAVNILGVSEEADAILIAAAIEAEGTYGAVIDSTNSALVLVYGGELGTGVAVAITTDAVGFTSTDVDFIEVAVTDLTGISENGGCPTLVFTMNPATFSSFCDINLNYFFPRQTDVVVVAYEGFLGNSTVATTTEMVYEDGSGYDIKQLEYEGGGWNGKPGPYRVGDLIGTAFEGFQYFADQSKSYNVIHLSHDQNSVSGWRDDNHFQRTIIATDDALDISDTIGALVNTITAGSVDPIVVCAD